MNKTHNKYSIFALWILSVIILLTLIVQIYSRFFSTSEFNIHDHLRIQSAELIQITDQTWVKLVIETPDSQGIKLGKDSHSKNYFRDSQIHWGIETNLGKGSSPMDIEIYYLNDPLFPKTKGNQEICFLLEHPQPNKKITSILYRFPYISIKNKNYYDVFEITSDFSNAQKKREASGKSIVNTDDLLSQNTPSVPDYLQFELISIHRKGFYLYFETEITNKSTKTIEWANQESKWENPPVKIFFKNNKAPLLLKYKSIATIRENDGIFRLNSKERMKIEFFMNVQKSSFYDIENFENMLEFEWKFEYFSIDDEKIYQGDFELKTQEFPIQKGKNEI